MTHSEKVIYYSVFKLRWFIIRHFFSAVNTGLDKMSFWQ